MQKLNDRLKLEPKSDFNDELSRELKQTQNFIINEIEKNHEVRQLFGIYMNLHLDFEDVGNRDQMMKYLNKCKEMCQTEYFNALSSSSRVLGFWNDKLSLVNNRLDKLK